MINDVKVLFFDVDDTLLDFRKCARKVLIDNFEKFGLKFEERYFDSFIKINDTLWKHVESGDITRRQLHSIRFDVIFAANNIDCDGKLFEESFLSGLSTAHEEVDGAIATVKALQSRYPLFVASNSAYEHQKKRLMLAGIYDCFTELFVSEDLGYAKPSKEFFEKAMQKAGITDAKNVLMIGDSYRADILGAHAVGMQTCWLTNSAEKKIEADYIIDDVSKLLTLLH